MTPLRLLNGYLLTILYDYLVTTQKLLTDYTLWLLCVWLTRYASSENTGWNHADFWHYYVFSLDATGSVLSVINFWMLRTTPWRLFVNALTTICDDSVSCSWCFFQAEIVGMSDFRRRGPVAIAELPAQHDNQDPASEYTQATHLPGLVRQSDWGDLRPEFTQVTKGAYVGQKPVSLCQGDVCPWSVFLVPTEH